MASRSYVKRQSVVKVTKKVLIVLWLLLFCLIIFAGYKIYNQSNQIIEKNKVGVGKSDEQLFDPFVLLMLYDDDFKETDNQIILLKFDEKSKKITCVCLPEMIDSTVRYKIGSLNAQIEYGGILQLKLAVENLFSVIVDKYIACPFSAIETIVDDMGGVEFNIEEKLYYTDEGLILTDLSAGLQTLNGQQVLEYLRYDWTDNYVKANKRAAISSVAFKKFFFNNNASKIENIFTKVANLLETDISIIDIYSLNEKVSVFEENTLQFIEVSGSQLELDDDVVDEINKALKG